MMMMSEKKNDIADGFNNRLNDSHLRSNIGTARPHKSLPGDVVVGQLTVVPYHDLSKEDISFKGRGVFQSKCFHSLVPCDHQP